MLDFESAREFYVQERRRRGLPIRTIVKQISDALGYEVSRDQLVNWEYKKTQPSVGLWRGLEWLIATWKLENAASRGIVREERDIYQADFECGRCLARVPGPNEGASYCLSCGAYYDFKICSKCHLIEKRLDAQFCIQCGNPFAAHDD